MFTWCLPEKKSVHGFSVKTKVRNLTAFAFLKGVVFLFWESCLVSKKELRKVVVDENQVL
jgi:hypothetical protein